ncbi:putative TM2 domain-containing protein [Sinorhizobium fredii HH103]|uniref:TM2 domain-containing protein n=1 Tax=Sinorhizobium fredii (strain HH103) TaxID=1117943 RepID=G9ABA9_SINF1|nr:TM2 domain-containing protein [Sinorhizobium fredii]CCE97200.1 putative TM2 domain-containing protein [Sinorhizobium fredii HH103]
MDLSTAEQILIEQRVTNESKSTAVAYLLWIFLGGLGAHRFYIGRVGSGLAILVLMIVGILLAPVGVGTIFLVPAVIWMLVDAFLIPGMIQQQKEEVRSTLGKQMYAERLIAAERGGR